MRIACFVLACMLLVALGPAPAPAAEYSLHKWVDSDGVVHIDDGPATDMPGSTAVETVRTEGRASSRPRNTQPGRSSGAMPASRPAVVVELYVTSWCPYCKKAKAYLDSRGIAYREFDVERDPEASKRKEALSPRGGVPVAVINGRVVTGFASDVYERALAGSR